MLKQLLPDGWSSRLRREEEPLRRVRVQGSAQGKQIGIAKQSRQVHHVQQSVWGQGNGLGLRSLQWTVCLGAGSKILRGLCLPRNHCLPRYQPLSPGPCVPCQQRLTSRKKGSKNGPAQETPDGA